MTVEAFLDARVVVEYPTLTVRVALEAARGDIVGLVGRNGAGKSTVLRAVAGLQPIDSGKITIASTVVDDPTGGVLVEAPKRRVGVVFQDYRLFPHMSALDNVAFGLRSRGMNKRQARGAALGWLERVDLADHLNHRPDALSGGQAQRVALARALATTPDVLLLDEPLAAIDRDARQRIRADLAGYLQGFQGVTVLVSHDHADIETLARRAIVIDAGTVAWEGPAEQLRTGWNASVEPGVS